MTTVPSKRSVVCEISPRNERGPTVDSAFTHSRYSDLRHRQSRLRVGDLRLPCFILSGLTGVGETIVGLDPFLGVVGGKQHGLKLIEIGLRQRLKFVVVALRTLKRQPQKRRRNDLLRGFQGRVAIDTNFIRVAITFAGTILPVTQIVRRDRACRSSQELPLADAVRDRIQRVHRRRFVPGQTDQTACLH